MRLKSACYVVGITFLAVFILCEFLIYYIVLAQCSWPLNPSTEDDLKIQPIRALILADTHLLGPFRGHWMDKLRREWQMHRAFQTSMQLFRPEVVFFLGDLFDEGHWVNHKQFREYVLRFHRLFKTSEGTRTIAVVGNHDVGFHYRLHRQLTERFDDAFNSTTVNLYTIRNVNFVTINSMAMENDGCHFCEVAQAELANISKILNCSKNKAECKSSASSNLFYSRPIVMQHFPTYRESDKNCLEGDAPEVEQYRENWEVLSRESTDFIGKTLNPRVVFSGHSHHFCRIKNRLKIEEYTLSSFSWRNKNNPSFLLVLFTPEDYTVSVCYLPEERTVKALYMYAGVLCCLIVVFSRNFNLRRIIAIKKTAEMKK